MSYMLALPVVPSSPTDTHLSVIESIVGLLAVNVPIVAGAVESTTTTNCVLPLAMLDITE